MQVPRRTYVFYAMKIPSYLILIALFFACEPVDYMTPYTQASNSIENTFRNSLRAVYYDSLLQTAENEEQAFQWKFLGAVERLRAGDSRVAAEEFAELTSQVERSTEMDSASKRNSITMLRRYEALSYLRLGEQENCINHHGSSSCILPIAVSAQHHETEGGFLLQK